MKRRPVVIYTYNAIDILLASPTEPTPIEKRTHQLSRMWQGLAALETAPQPTANDWRVCSDAANLLETLVAMGECQDSSGLLHDAIAALAVAGARHLEEGKPIRLTGQGMQSVRAVLEDYAEVLEQIPHRTALDAHRRTERRIHEISTGKKKPHDVEVMKL
jgi:hypothetical protein